LSRSSPKRRQAQGAEASGPKPEQADERGSSMRAKLTTGPIDYQLEFKRARVRQFDQDLRTMTTQQLRAEFAASSSGRILVKELCRNVVYQAYSWIQKGKAPAIDGNLRSLFYQWLKPVLSKLAKMLARTKTDPYDEMLNAMEFFVVDLKLFRYEDFGLVDERWENRFFSDGRKPNVLVFAEKNGFVKFLQEVSRRFGVHAIALGGSPSHLSTEFLVSQLRKKFKSFEPLVLYGITDYDPSGADIAASFKEQLERQGVKIASMRQLVEPKAFLAEELTTFRFPVPTKYPTRVQRWLKGGGGLEGQALGLEADSLPKTRLLESLDAMLTIKQILL
jgi:hypothetical protein